MIFSRYNTINNIIVLLYYCFYNNQSDTSSINEKIDSLNKKIITKLGNSLFSYYIVASKNSNSGIFSHFFDNNEDVKILKTSFFKFEVDKELTEKYNSNCEMPSNKQFIITTNFYKTDLFKNTKFYNVDLDIRHLVTNDIVKDILLLLSDFKRLNMRNYRNFTLDVKKYSNYTYTKFKYLPIGTIESTNYNYDNQIFNKLKSHISNIKKLLQKEHLNSFFTKASGILLHELNNLNVFKNYPINLEEYPDLFSIIFPYKMIEKSLFEYDKKYLITFGFDLRNALKSNLKFLFNEKVVREINEQGGIFLITTSI